MVLPGKICTVLSLLSLLPVILPAAVNDCATCHQYEWSMQNSAKAVHHTLAGRKLSDKLDSGVFSGRTFSDSSGTYKFFKEGEKFKISVEDKESSKTLTYDAIYSIGVEPLIQYVVSAERGAFQVLNIAYDTKKDEFFDVFSGEKRLKGEWGHWLSRGMNWNSNCAYCHNVAFKKNYSFESDSYNSSMLEPGIGCLQCHPALPEACGHKELPLLKKRLTPRERMFACASCHSRREQLNADRFIAGEDYFDSFRPELPVVKGIYYPDGKVKEEDFVFSSFMMCRQFTAGLTCTDCHDKHLLRTFRPIDNNQLCLSCHAPDARGFKGAPTIIANEHSAHPDGEGNLCVNCHMPKTVYMGRDARYDHGFTSPDPLLTKLAGIPNACSQCHEKIDAGKPERNLDWLIDYFNKHWGSERFLNKRARSLAVARAHDGDLSDENKTELLKALAVEDNLAWKATIMNLLLPRAADEDVQTLFKNMLKSESPLIRSAAVRGLSALPENVEILKGALSDPSTMVRIDSAFSLGRESVSDKRAHSELIEYLEFNSDSSIGLLKRADYALRSGSTADAEKFALAAMNLEPLNPEFRRQVAVILLRANMPDKAMSVLKKAKEDFPSSADVSYALALLYAQMGDLNLTVSELENTVKLNPGFSRAWYNLSVALFRTGNVNGAINAADKAAKTDKENAAEYLELKKYYMHSQAN